MRVTLFIGKGVVGKTSLAAATALLESMRARGRDISDFLRTISRYQRP